MKTIIKGIAILLGTIVVLFFALALIAALLGKHPAPSTQKPVEQATLVAQTSPVVTAEPTVSATATPAEEKPKQMGEEFKMGDFTYKITNAFAVGGIERAFQKSLRAADGAAFVIVEYSIRNDGKESDDMWVNGLKLQDSQGREFEASSEVKIEIEMRSKRNDMFVKQLQPGITRQLKEGFEIPKDALTQPLVLLVSERGFFSSGEAKVNLVVTKRTKEKKKN